MCHNSVLHIIKPQAISTLSSWAPYLRLLFLLAVRRVHGTRTVGSTLAHEVECGDTCL